MRDALIPFTKNRLGIHYFPDLNHYHERDLKTWLPKLDEMGIGWLTLIAPTDCFIPKAFIQGLLSHQITPILHFPFRPELLLPYHHLEKLLSVYSGWGVRYAAFFDRPNSQSTWNKALWIQEDLIGRFLDIFLPIAEIALQNDIIPIFPPLTPGGDYWDIVFLRSSLRGIEQRGHIRLLENLVLSAIAWASDRPLNWGCGGPERWTEYIPYMPTSSKEEDHLGFRIFDWYQAIAKAILGKPCRFVLFRAGSYSNLDFYWKSESLDIHHHSLRNLAIAKALDLESSSHPTLPNEPEETEPIPPEVLACNFWLLSTSPNSMHVPQAWYKPDESHLPIVDYLQQMNIENKRRLFYHNETLNNSAHLRNTNESSIQEANPNLTQLLNHNANANEIEHPLSHYLLIPSFEWGVSDHHLDLARVYIKRYRPIVGFSLDTARLAKHVTIIGGEKYFPQEKIIELRKSGCIVECIGEDGTNIAFS